MLEAVGKPRGWQPEPQQVEVVLRAITYKSTWESFDYDMYEMMGDAFLKYAAATWLYDNLPDASEANMSVRKHKLVANGTLNRAMRKFGLDKFVRTGRFV